MAKGTSYSDVNYSVPEGADPLGIGVPDLGKSSYDPIATIRHGWESSRLDRAQNKQMDQQNYQAYMKSMPTVDGVNQHITRSLNKDLGKMGSLFKRKQGAGGFAGFAKGEGGGSLEAELANLENKVAGEIPIYNSLSKQYEKDYAAIRSGANQDKIDRDLTQANVKRMQDATNLEEFAAPFSENGGSLVVYKPEPQDIIGYAKKVGSMIEGENIISSDIKIDPNTNTMTTTQVTGADPEIIHKAYQTGYEMAEPNMRNAIDGFYKAATDKKNADGVVMDAKEWFANKFSGLHGTTTTKKTSRLPKGDKPEPSGLTGGISRMPDGTIDTEAMKEPIVMKQLSTTPAKYKDKLIGKGQKKTAEEATTAEEMEFEAFNLPLTGIDAVFDSITPASSMDASTGEEPDRTKIGSHKGAAVSFMPTYNGESDLPIEIEVEDKDGNMVKKKYTVKPGKPIPFPAQRELIKRGVLMKYEPYLLTKSVYGAAQEQKNLGTISWSDYVSAHGKTIVTPWTSVDNAFLTKMGAEEYEIEELMSNMAEFYTQINKAP